MLMLMLVCYIMPVQAGLLDRFKSPSGVYTCEVYVNVITTNLEEIDIRSDKSFVWKTTMRIRHPDPDMPGMDRVSYLRGSWKSSFGEVSFYIDGYNDAVFIFVIDDGDLIEKTGSQRRFSKMK